MIAFSCHRGNPCWLTLAGSSPDPILADRANVCNQNTYGPFLMRQRSSISWWCRNLNLLSIDYAFRPRLRSDSPWVDLRCPGNLGFSVGGVFTRRFATYPNILTSCRSTRPYGRASSQQERSSTTLSLRIKSSASVPRLSPYKLSAQSDLTSELLRFL